MPRRDDRQATTAMLLAAREGEVPEALPHAVYRELRALAGGIMKNERATHTLQPTALAHEAYVRLVDQDQVRGQDRRRFFGIAARLMRQILVDHARRRDAQKRGGGARARTLIDVPETSGASSSVDLIALGDALDELARLDDRKCRVVELRFFANMNHEETAEALGCSPATVRADWRMAKTWLATRLGS